MIVVFSKDRAFQLEACLRTLYAHCADIADLPTRVLWTASSLEHRRAYDVLQKEWRPQAGLQFVRETRFRADTVAILGQIATDSWRDRLVRSVATGEPIGWKGVLQGLVPLLLDVPAATLFVVDDTVFLRPFRFADCAQMLKRHPDCLAFSLRLGSDITRFYMGDREQVVPQFKPVDGADSVGEFDWTSGDGDFGYPLEISSSLLRTALVLARLLRKPWRNPNTLELALANMAGRYRRDLPRALTFREPRAVSIPLNMVQSEFKSNRAGTRECDRPEALCQLFLEGVRADLSRLEQARSNAVHTEFDLLPESRL